MLREQVRVGMQVLFGRPNGAKTLGVVEKINPTKAKVKTLEARGTSDTPGTLWTVPFSLLYPVGGSAEHQAMPRQISLVRQRVEQLINLYGLGEVIDAVKDIAGKTEL
jgi:hypothetical protein